VPLFALAGGGALAYTLSMDLSDFRKEYLKESLRRGTLADCPLVQFDIWFKQALVSGISEPNSMSLATSTASGFPSLRTVLLKYYDERGFVFFTNYKSRKAQEMEENSEVCMMLPWVDLERQVIVYGRAEKISRAESLRYFLTRPHESQLGAWVSQQSQAVSARKLLLMKLEEIKRKFQQGKVPIPDFWGGYRIVPHHVEFWQGGAGRVHDRFMYTLNADARADAPLMGSAESSPQAAQWSIERLQP